MKFNLDKNETIKKILLIKLRGIGDVVLSTIVLDNLKEIFPNAKIDFLSDKPGTWAVEKIPQINDVIIFDRGSTLNRIKQIFQIRKRKYDIVFDFFTNPATALLTYFSGAKYRIGYPYKGRKYAYNLYGPEARDKHHAAKLHLEVLKEIGLPVESKNLHFGMEKSDEDFSKEFIQNSFSGDKLLLGISPSGGWKSKKCDPVKFAEIADAIVDEFGFEVLIVWGPDDKKEAEEIKDEMKSPAVFAPPTSIRQMGALISNCDLIVANDSGPMHISTAVGTPTLSLHGPTNPRLQGPFGKKHEWILKDNLDCIVCNLLDCNRNHECFLTIEPAEVIEKIYSLCKKNGICV